PAVVEWRHVPEHHRTARPRTARHPARGRGCRPPVRPQGHRRGPTEPVARRRDGGRGARDRRCDRAGARARARAAPTAEVGAAVATARGARPARPRTVRRLISVHSMLPTSSRAAGPVDAELTRRALALVDAGTTDMADSVLPV